jgi:hypothetical protein
MHAILQAWISELIESVLRLLDAVVVLPHTELSMIWAMLG